MKKKMAVIKLGGALLTDKKRPFTLRQAILDQVAAEISACLDQRLIDQLILVHGVGSFGHPPVVEHQLHKGYQSPDQLIHLTHTQNVVMQMRLAVAEALHKAGIAVSTIFPSSCMAAKGTSLKTSYYDAVAGFLDLGMTPLLGGDMLADDQVGFCVFSGDKIAVNMALHFGASHLIFATEVDGIYEKDPYKFAEAQRVEQFSLSNQGSINARLDDRRQVDASGAMAGKLAAVQAASGAITAGLEVYILSMTKEGSLQNLLSGKRANGTLILP